MLDVLKSAKIVTAFTVGQSFHLKLDCWIKILQFNTEQIHQTNFDFALMITVMYFYNMLFIFNSKRNIIPINSIRLI